MTDAAEELASLRNLLAEALSDAADGAVSQGALELRRKFSQAAMARLDASFERPKQEVMQREGD